MVWHIGEILVQKRLISWEQLQDVLEEQKQTREMTGEILIRKHYVSELLFYKALAEQHHIPYIDLRRTKIDVTAVKAIPKKIAEQFEIMPVGFAQSVLTVAISNPTKFWPQSDIKTLAKASEIKFILTTPSAIREAIRENYSASGAVSPKLA